jgi:hypothetical protein
MERIGFHLLMLGQDIANAQIAAFRMSTNQSQQHIRYSVNEASVDIDSIIDALELAMYQAKRIKQEIGQNS